MLGVPIKPETGGRSRLGGEIQVNLRVASWRR